MILVRTPLRVSFAGGGTDLPAYYQKGDLLLVHDYPKEFGDKDIECTDLTRMKLHFLRDTRLVLFHR